MTSIAELQRAPDAPHDPGLATLPLKLERVRTFATPEFAGMRFLEVETKSALNRVRGMPFPWSINPYRGCSHACAYCLSGDTPILMADGRTRPLADLRTGDAIYGTIRRGAHRGYVVTHVLDHWSTTKPAYRVTLDDGTELIASGDHRFLTNRGWRHVTAAPQGQPPRLHLTLGSQLIGPGRSAAPPAEAADHRLRYFRGTITRERSIEGRAVMRDLQLRVVAIEPLGRDLPLFDITTGTGDFIANGVVSHNCFARPSHSYLNLSPLDDFERTIVVKTNLVEVLRRELARPSWTGEQVAMGTNTDPYQRCEGRYRLMPGIIDALAEGFTPFSILTKGTLITRDVETLQAAAERVSVSCALTVGMLDPELWRQVEPGAPSPQARLEAVARLRRAGIPTGVMLAPIMPGLNDDPDALDALVDAAAAAGAVHITPIVLHLRPGVRELFWPWLEQTHPDLVDLYRQLYRGANASTAYRGHVEGLVAQRRRAAWARHGRPDGHPSVRAGTARSAPERPKKEARQLRLL
ncbi:MAG: radical SAM protein [Egibacteraceae bacterium]